MNKVVFSGRDEANRAEGLAVCLEEILGIRQGYSIFILLSRKCTRNKMIKIVQLLTSVYVVLVFSLPYKWQ